jgi:hypothetical protein
LEHTSLAIGWTPAILKNRVLQSTFIPIWFLLKNKKNKKNKKKIKNNNNKTSP